MKHFYLLSLCLLAASLASDAQWLDNSNQFKDSLHMPVSVATRDQEHTVIVKGDDGSYFMLWQDTRNASTNKTDIYAQKFDRDGKRLWAVDGVPVATGANDEMFRSSQNVDYRRYSYAAPDGVGGLYVCWNYNAVISPYTYWGVSVQHLHADGSRVWGDEGKGVGVPVAGAAFDYLWPQLVTDEHGGFFIAYITTPGNYRDCYAYCYKDEGGTLKS
ncbi:MAG: hypothetical protein JST42_02505, partial [Bacteroidetes bacterium]|nr:hypothetical protein [Bacteroidota bacterium]